MIQKLFDNRWTKLVLAACIPVLGALLLLIVQGVSFGELTVVNSRWNDELFYYKQIEGMVKYGIPQGYFGFNESTSIYGNFAAWSPAILAPYALVGKVFGWTKYTPMLFHLGLWMVAFCVFQFMLRPTYKQLLVAGGVWISFEVGIRYIFSVTPESMLTSLVFLFFIILYKMYTDGINKFRIILIDIILILLILMRGYYGALAILIWYVVWEKGKSKIILVAQVITAAVGTISYGLILHFCTAKYFEQLVSTDWITNPKRFVKLILFGFIESLQYIWDMLIRMPSHEGTRGAWYAVYIILGIWLLILYIKKKDKIFLASLLVWVIMVWAMWLLYNAKEGSRQLMAVGVAGLIMVTYISVKEIWGLLVIAILIYSSWLSRDEFFTKLSVEDQANAVLFEQAKEDLTALMPITYYSWDNTLIKSFSLDHRPMYAIPDGIGLNSYEDELIMENIDSLKSKYIATDCDEEIDRFISQKGYKLLYSYGDTNIYLLR